MGWRDWLGLQPRMDDFAQTLITRCRQQLGNRFTHDRAEGTLRGDDGSVLNLANMYGEYARAPRSQRAALIDKYLAVAGASKQSTPKLWDLAAKSIYPVVRSRFERELMKFQGRTEGMRHRDVLNIPWIDDLEIRIVYDWGLHVSLISEEFVETWGQSLDAIMARALENLAALPKPMWQPLGRGVHELVTDTSYQESLLLIDKFLDPLSFKESAVCIPSNRGVLLACDANQPDSVAAMMDEAARNLQDKPWPLTGTLLKRVGPGSWNSYQPDQALLVRAANLQRLNEAITYQSQKSLLDASNLKTHTDVYVAEYGLYRVRDSEALRSWCTWSQGIHSLLPKTDFIALSSVGEDGQAKPLVLSWDRATAALGHRMKRTDDLPERYEVLDGASDSERSQLQAEDWA